MKSLILRIGLLITGVYLLIPALSSEDPEGYTAQLASMAELFRTHGIQGIVSYDPVMSLSTEFLFLTRQGIIVLLALLANVFGWENWRILTATGWFVLFICSVILSVRISKVPIAAAIGALLMCPGFTELAFYYNDNVVAAAFAAGAMLLVARGNPVSMIPGGFLMGYAVLCRPDAVLAVPFMLVWMREIRYFMPSVYRILLLCTGFCITMLGSFFFTGTNFMEVAEISSLFASRVALFHPVPAILFLGLPVMPLLIIGWFVSDIKDRPGIVILKIYPLFLLAFAVTSGTNLRYIYPMLTPAIAMFGGSGIMCVMKTIKLQGLKRTASQLFIFVVFSVFVIFPDGWFMLDGPHTLTGRIWSVPIWNMWQNSVEANKKSARVMADELSKYNRTLVITSHYNEDFFLKRELIATGWNIRDVHDVYPKCMGFYIYSKGTSTVMHIRSEALYGLDGARAVSQRALLSVALSCPETDKYDAAWLGSDDRSSVFIPSETYGEIAEKIIVANPPKGIVFTSLSKDEIEDIKTHVMSIPIPDSVAVVENIIRVYRLRYLR